MIFAAAAFVGCAQDDGIGESPTVNKAIEFGTYVGRDAESRASVVDIKALKEQGFGVYAYYTKGRVFDAAKDTTPNFMNNQEVTYTASGTTPVVESWSYAPVKYWPNNPEDYVSFFAYAPYNAAGVMEGPSSIKFTVQDIASQTDLLWNKTKTVDLTKQKIQEKVQFTFAHALARIGFTVQGAVDKTVAGGTLDEKTTITVKKVILSGKKHVYGTDGAITYPTAVADAGAFYKEGVLNLNNWTDAASWTGIGTDKLSFTLETSNFTNTTGVELKGDQSKPTKLNNDASYLMIIPQEFTGEQLYVFIEYTVTTEDTNLDGGKAEITNYVSTPLAIDFVSGHAYNLNLILGMTSVKVEATYTDWTSEDKEVWLPTNTDDSGTGTGGGTGTGN